MDLNSSDVMRVNLVDNKVATVTQDCVIRVWHLDFQCDGQVSCQCLHTLTTFKPRYRKQYIPIINKLDGI